MIRKILVFFVVSTIVLGTIILTQLSCTTRMLQQPLNLYSPEKQLSLEGIQERFSHVADDGVIYRGAPLYSWNGDLAPEELRRQIREFKKAGLGGFFMHGRVGLITSYLSPQWMKCVEASIDEAESDGMYAWFYDENGFPSGGAGGQVAAGGEEYQRKNLVCSKETPETFKWKPNTVAVFEAQSRGNHFDNLRRLSQDESTKLLPPDTTILHFYYNAGGYVDVLSKKAIRRFIDLTYEQYWQTFKDKFGKVIPGIFTDEPSYGLLPWSFDLPGRFRQQNGYDIDEILPALFWRVEGYQKARHDYWSTVSYMFVEAYMGQIGQWCKAHDIALTGHVAWAETLMGQMTFHAASMPLYETMAIPGTNHLGVRLMNAMREKQLVSVARQTGKERVLCEIAGATSWGVSFEELKWITDWQMALGINLLCQHLQHYTLHGLTKRDVPPSYSYQQPWWSEYKTLNDYFARIIFMLTQGKSNADILLIHPIDSAWIMFDGSDIAGSIDTHGGPELIAYDELQNEICNALLSIHRDFDYGDERIIARHGKIAGDKFIVGNAQYPIVVLPKLLSIQRKTLQLLKEFINNGGKVFFLDALPTMIDGVPSDEPSQILAGASCITLPAYPANFQKAGRHTQPKTYIGTRLALKQGLDKISMPALEILDKNGQSIEHIWAHQRDLAPDNTQILWLVNFSRNKVVDATVRLRNRNDLVVEHWDAITSKEYLLNSRRDGEYITVDLKFEPMQSYLMVFRPAHSKELPPVKEKSELSDTLPISGDWTVEPSDPNALTVDWCRWAIGDNRLSEPQPTIKARTYITEYLGQHPQPEPELLLEYTFTITPETMIDKNTMLVVETPELFSITVNGQKTSSEDVGWWRDIAFRKIPIGTHIQNGLNTITLKGKFTPRTEIESIYITGDFGTRSIASARSGDRNTVLTDGPFEICPKISTIRSGNLNGNTDLTSQGYWFYAGNIKMSQSFDLSDEWSKQVRTENAKIRLELEPPDCVLMRLIVNGKDAGVKFCRPYHFELTNLLLPGKNSLTMELYGSCRNLLGPHHHWRGEVLYTGTAFSLTKVPDEDEPQVPENTWVDRYCFTKFGLSGAPELRLVK